MRNLFRRPEKAAIQAVGDDEFATFLKSIGVYKDICDGKKRCKFCKNVVSVTSISYVFPDSGSIKFVCDKPECTTALIDYINEGKSI